MFESFKSSRAIQFKNLIDVLIKCQNEYIKHKTAYDTISRNEFAYSERQVNDAKNALRYSNKQYRMYICSYFQHYMFDKDHPSEKAFTRDEMIEMEKNYECDPYSFTEEQLINYNWNNTNMQGGKYKYNNKSYKIHTGQRGGKYIITGGKKKYI